MANEDEYERAPMIAAALSELRQVQTGNGHGAERTRVGRLGGGRRVVATSADEDPTEE